MSALAAPHRPPTCESETARLFEAHAEQIFRYCLRRAGSRSDAEDAVQTTFLQALRALQRGVVPECESAWLTTIAKNVCRWQRRTLDRRGSLTDDFDPDSVGGVERIARDDEELCQVLRSALASIPESQQRALVLSEWHGLSSGEVAAELGMSTPATYALLTRARRSMAQALTTFPRQAALGLASLVYELRRTIKGLLGGAGTAAKTVAATTVVAAVAVGGVSAQTLLASERPAQSRTHPASVVETRGVAASPESRDLASRVRRRSSTSSLPVSTGRGSVSRPQEGIADEGAVEPVTPVGEDAAAPADLVEETTGSAEELLEGLPLDPLPLPGVELLTDVLPPTELPVPLEPPTLGDLPDPSLPAPLEPPDLLP